MDDRIDGDGDAPVDDLVRHQRRIVAHWSRYARGCADRLQSGNFDPSAWLGAYANFVRETANDFVGTLRALCRLRGER